MMGWISRNSSSTGSSFVVDRKKVEPGAAFSLLENHWKQAKAVMDSPISETAADALTVISHMNQMVSFLRLTRNEDPKNCCKKFWVQTRCSDKVLQWLHSLQIKGTLLEYEDEKKLVQTLESLCEMASQDGELLGYNSCSGEGSYSDWTDPSSNIDGAVAEVSIWDGACSLSSLLLEYSLKSDPCLGEPARNSFIILIKLSAKYPQLEKCFSKEMGLELTNVVISGLSACFAQLPTFYPGTLEQIEPFRTQLKFVDAVTHAAPSSISRTIADCFSNTFLTAVILPALTQDDGNRSLHRQDDNFVTSLHEEIAIVTNYLKTICEYLTHPGLVKSLVTFIMNNLLPVLLQRMNHQNESVTVSTLGLLSTLFNFYCEDLWYELVLRHLMSQSHLMVSQRTVRLPVIDYQDASLRFMSLIPSPILEVMGPQAISYHYAQYLDNEISRLPLFLTQEFSFPGQQSTNGIAQSSVFLLWKNKYDGTDEILPPLKSPNLSYQDPPTDPQPSMLHNLEMKSVSNLNNVVDPLTAAVSDQEESHCSTVQEKDRFTTISLQPTDEQLHSLGAGSNATSDDPLNPSVTNEIYLGSDGYGSLESEINGSVTADSASLGPFLDILLNHLKNLTKLSPDMILMVTEIFSILARSRVPLVTSIFLDTRIILQPSYLSFPLLLNRIRVEFEHSLKSHCNVLGEVWSNYSKEIIAAELQNPAFHNLSISSSVSMNFIQSLSNSLDSSFGESSFTENIKKKINNSSLLNNVFQRKASPASNSKNYMPTSSPVSAGRNYNASELNDSRPSASDNLQSPTNLQNYRHRTGQNVSSESPITQNNQSTESLRITAARAIYFSHWLLELSAIAQQFCWKRPFV